MLGGQGDRAGRLSEWRRAQAHDLPEGSNDAAATVEQTTGTALAPQEIATVVVGSSKLPDDQKYEAEITEAGCA